MRGEREMKWLLSRPKLSACLENSPIYIYKKPIARLIGQLRRVKILLPNIFTLLSCPISLAIGVLFYSTLLILIYTKIRLHLATVCPSGPCIELPIYLRPSYANHTSAFVLTSFVR